MSHNRLNCTCKRNEVQFMQTNYLNESLKEQLYPYQVERIERQIHSYISINHSINDYHFDVCPKCGVAKPRLIKGGISNSGKQMLRCKECGKRFTIDYGQLTHYSHQTQAAWNDFIVDTFHGNPLTHTAAKINISESTAFRMRHKFLHALEKLELPIHA